MSDYVNGAPHEKKGRETLMYCYFLRLLKNQDVTHGNTVWRFRVLFASVVVFVSKVISNVTGYVLPSLHISSYIQILVLSLILRAPVIYFLTPFSLLRQKEHVSLTFMFCISSPIAANTDVERTYDDMTIYASSVIKQNLHHQKRTPDHVNCYFKT